MKTAIFDPGEFDDGRRENRELQEQLELQLQIENRFYEVEDYGSKTHKYWAVKQRLETAIKELRQDSPKEAFPTTQEMGMHYLFLLLLFAAYVISLLLIFRPTEYLVGLLVGENGLIKALGILLVPLAIISLQIYTGIDFYLAKNKKETLKSLAEKKRAAWVMVLVTPGMILGTFLAEIWGHFPWPHEVLLLLARLALAYLTDASIVSNGEQAYKAKAFFIFGLQHRRLLREHDQATTRVEDAAYRTVQSFQGLQQKKAEFAARYPDADLILPQLSAIARWVLERWMGGDFNQGD